MDGINLGKAVLGGVVAGLVISFHFDTAAGATMSGFAVALFFVTLAVRTLVVRLLTRRPARV